MLSPRASPPLSRPSSGASPVLGQNDSKTADVEMTPPLTVMDDGSKSDEEAQPESMSSFTSVKDRVDRNSRLQGSGASGFNGATNWRRSVGSAELDMGGQEVLSSPRSLFNSANEDMVHIGSVVPGPAWPKEEQLKVAFAYGIRRDDGTYTRLIRADELQMIDLKNVPVSQGPEGLIALPMPKLVYPERREGPEQFITRDFLQKLPQNRAFRPKIPAYPGAVNKDVEDVQREIDQITSSSPIASPPAVKTPRRQKIYCDKWIHEGICSFVQLGCKYKHEMPLDKATQLSLGLNHGLPIWYKRAQSVQLRPEIQMPAPPHIAGPWRRADGSAANTMGLSLGSDMPSSPPGQGAFLRSNFGPIGPPAPRCLQSTMSTNPFASLQEHGDLKMEEEDDDDDEEGEITWPGRRG